MKTFIRAALAALTAVVLLLPAIASAQTQGKRIALLVGPTQERLAQIGEFMPELGSTISAIPVAGGCRQRN